MEATPAKTVVVVAAAAAATAQRVLRCPMLRSMHMLWDALPSSVVV